MTYDLVIRDGLIVDGVSNMPFRSDIGIIGDRICFVGKIGGGDTAVQTVRADGRVVCPGFIDVHCHSELSVLNDRHILAKISQGVTTELSGQCGISAFPSMQCCRRSIADYVAPVLGTYDGWTWGNGEEYRAEANKRGAVVNQINFVGHGNLRIHALGFQNQKAGPKEIRLMVELLENEIRKGAWGLSSGLVYAPGVFSDMDEMTALAAVCKKYNAIYTTHMRNEGGMLLESVAETIQVALSTKARTVISHLKAMGQPNHGKVAAALALMGESIAQGADLFADCYPYTAASTTMTVVLPPWTLGEGVAGLMKILKNEQSRKRITCEFETGLPNWDNRTKTIGWDRLRVSSVSSERNKRLEGLSLAQIAGQQQKKPAEALFDLLLEENAAVTAILDGMSEMDMRLALDHERVMVCSDGIPSGEKPHPRLFGAITRYLGRYAQLDLPDRIGGAIKKLTVLPAQVYSIPDRGVIAQGKIADIVILQPDKVMDCATFAKPCVLSEGIDEVFVGGKPAYADKKLIRPDLGKFLYKNL